MPKFRNYQTNFSGGLLSEGMLGRLDLAQYENGCKQLTNWWPKVTGGMRRRPGSVYLATPANAVRLESFVFSETQIYLVVFCSDNTVKFYNEDTGALIQSLTITGITLDATIIPQLSITQSADVMFCAHENFIPLMIRRTSATTFAQEAYAFESLNPADAGAYPIACPFIKYEDSDVTISVSGHLEGASVTVTASEAVFADRHVNRAIRYRGKQLLVTAVGTPGGTSTTCTATIKEDLDRGATLTFNATLESAQDFEVGEIVVGRDSGIKGEVVDKTNTVLTLSLIAGLWPVGATEQVEGLTTGNIATITANSTTTPVATADWDEEAFSDDRGWPSVIEFHSQRLWLAGSSSLPAHIFGSRVAAFFNFDVGDAFPADSIQVVISDKQVNQITDVVSGRHLQVFTDAGEFYAPQSEDLPLEPETFDLRKQTRYGTKRYQEPKVFDESTLFVQAQGNAVREFIWVDNLRGYSSDAISLISEEHLANIQEIEVLYGGYDRPEQIAFFVNGDGTIVWYHAARAEQIRTWGKWTTQGNYKSLTAMQDTLYGLVERTIDGTTSMFLERFELHMTVDCGVTKVSSGLTPVTGFTNHVAHLPNTVVDAVLAVTADGSGDLGGGGVADQALDADYYIGEITTDSNGTTVINAAIAIEPVTNLTCGLGFTQTLEIMPIEIKDRNGITTGMPKRIVYADMYMASTLAAKLEGNRILTYIAEFDPAIRPTAVTGLRKFYLLGYEERPTLVIENEVPLPFEALSLGAEVEY